MTQIPIGGLPGIQSQRTSGYRTVFKTDRLSAYMPGLAIIDGTKSRDTGNTGDLDVLRAGLLMGRITSGGKWANSIMGLSNAAYAAGATSLTVTSAAAVELARRIGASGTFKIVGPPGANGIVAVETVTYSAIAGTTVTITALANSYISGSFLMPTDGSEAPITFVPDGAGIKVTDVDAVSQDQEFPLRPIAGIIDSSQLINWPADTSLQAWMVGQLNDNSAGQFAFDHLFN